MKITKTKRGFKKGEFLDFNGVKCSIQMSSLDRIARENLPVEKTPKKLF